MLDLHLRLGKASASLLACSLLISACGDLPTSANTRLSADDARPRAVAYTTTGTVKRVTVAFGTGSINRTAWTLPVGLTQTFVATAYDSIGRVITGRAVKWASMKPSILGIDTAGVSTALAIGTGGMVSATVDGITGKSASFTIVVNTTPPAPTPPPTPGPLPITSVVVRHVSGGLDTTTWNLAPGVSEQFSATAYDSTGAIVTGQPVVFHTSNAAAIAVDTVTGVATATAPGSGSVTASIAGVTGTSQVITVPVVQAPPTPSATSVNMSVSRFDVGTGSVIVSSGFPLVAGTIFPGQENMVRVSVGGTEQPVYVTGLTSRHPDGSLRAVLVQFRLTSLGVTPAIGRIDFASPRPTGMTLTAPLITPGTLVSGVPNGLPQAAALPTDPTYLIATDLVGPTTTVAANTLLGGMFAKYDADFVTHSNLLWTQEGAKWDGNYYDRALIYYAMWVRTGNPLYWLRAGQIAYDYRVRYLEANAYGASPHWSQLEGLEKHFLLTGDDKSRVAVGSVGNKLYGGFINSNYMTRVNGESRIAARVLHAQLLGWRLSSSTVSLAGNTQAAWGSRVDAALSKIFAWQQSNGSFPADGQVCGGQLNYMVGLQNEVLIKTYDYYVPTATTRAALQTTLKSVVQKAVDYLWTTQWLAASKSFKYASVQCPNGGPVASPDLNNLISPAFGWLYKVTGTTSYLTNGDAIYSSGVLQAYLNNSKQFNEEYTASFRYLGYR